MQSYSLRKAQENLRDLVAAALDGETVLIVGENEQIVQIVPVSSPRKPRKAGSARSQIQIADDFDAPLNDFDEYME